LTWESISEQQKASWLEEIKTMHDWVVWCKSQKGREEIRSFELSWKEIFFNYYETKSTEVQKKKTGSQKSAYKGAKRVHIANRAFDTGHGGNRATSKWQ